MSNDQYNQINTSNSLQSGIILVPQHNQLNSNVNNIPNSNNPNYLPSGIINNQPTSPQTISTAQIFSHLKSSPAYINCPHCTNLAVTKTESELNLSNLCCSICFGVIIWLGFQACREKDINCYDSVHKCSKCGAVLNKYSAC